MDQVMLKNSFYEKTARARIQAVVDENSFKEILKPTEIEVSPHLSALDIPGSFDDGVIIGRLKQAEPRTTEDHAPDDVQIAG